MWLILICFGQVLAFSLALNNPTKYMIAVWVTSLAGGPLGGHLHLRQVAVAWVVWVGRVH